MRPAATLSASSSDVFLCARPFAWGTFFSLFSFRDSSYLFLKIYLSLNLYQDRLDALLQVPTELSALCRTFYSICLIKQGIQKTKTLQSILNLEYSVQCL